MPLKTSSSAKNKKSEKKVSVNSKNELKLYRELLPLLHTPRRYEAIRPVINQFGLEQNLSVSGLGRLERRVLSEGLNKLKLKWKGSYRTIPDIYSTLPSTDVNPLEVAIAFYPRSYLCYQTALFWNELTKQVPRTFFIAQERPSTSSKTVAPENFDDFELRDAFVKPPKEHPNVASLGEYRFVFLARAYTGSAGVELRDIPFKQKKVPTLITGLERTLLDCIAVPENAGGISNVVDATKQAAERIKLDSLIELYSQLEFKYPHWQRIGLLLDRVGHLKLAKRWGAQFGPPKNKFYLTKGYKLEWEFDESWGVYYPRGLFK
ncbi:MAG: hypothetical protein HY308_03415 [Gammaproteobacteria bacterium]|nr:hypothetical protein [Gammaproteobacteria bacterium]